MTRTLRSVVVLGTAAVALPLAVAAPASATTTERLVDRVRDAAATVDITRLDASWTTSTVDVTVRVRDLRSTGKLVIGGGVAGWGYNYVVTRSARGVTKQVHGYSEVADLGAWSCPRMSVTWSAARNLVRVVVPVSCTGSRAFDEGEVVVNGADLTRAGRHDRVGRVYYRP